MTSVEIYTTIIYLTIALILNYTFLYRKNKMLGGIVFLFLGLYSTTITKQLPTIGDFIFASSTVITMIGLYTTLDGFANPYKNKRRR